MSINITETVNGTQTQDTDGQHSILVPILLIWLPGTVLNTIALAFIIRDVRKAVIPAFVLLLFLCLYDLLSVLFTITQHVLARFVVITDGICATVTFFFSYFKVSSGVFNSLMAIDRVIAICAPFYYKRHFRMKTWVLGGGMAGVLIAIYSIFPLIGLGDIWVQKGPSKRCIIGFQADPVKRVYRIMFGILGIVFEAVLIGCNIVLIRTLLKMKNRVIADIPPSRTESSNSSGDSSRKKASPFEVVFAKLMIGLSLCYLILGTPSKVVVILEQVEIPVTTPVRRISYSLGGYIQVVDPIIYILVRKLDLKKLKEMCCRCCRRNVS